MNDNISNLERLIALRDKGALTEDEFQKQKTILLSDENQNTKQPKNTQSNTIKAPKKRGCFSRVITLIAFIVFAFIILGVVVNSFESTDSTTSTNQSTSSKREKKRNMPQAPQVVSIDVIQLNAEYAQNEVRTDDKYQGKLMNITGYVSAISKDLIGSVIVNFNTGDSFSPAGMHMRDSENQAAANLNIGQQITVQCASTSYVIGAVVAQDCVFVH